MKPTLLQYFFARDWLLWAWCATFSVATPIVVLSHAITFEWLFHWRSMILAAVIVLVGLPLGFYLSLIPAACIFVPLHGIRGMINGAPFRVGDTVIILVGPYRDKVVRVYSTWQGDCVRVRLTDDDERNCTDIFMPTQLLRISPHEPVTASSAAANASGSRSPGSADTAGDTETRGTP